MPLTKRGVSDHSFLSMHCNKYVNIHDSVNLSRHLLISKIATLIYHHYYLRHANLLSVAHLLSSPSKSGISSPNPLVSLSFAKCSSVSLVTALKLSMFSSNTFGRISFGATACLTLCHSLPFLCGINIQLKHILKGTKTFALYKGDSKLTQES